ncbi:MAG: permease [Sedimentisphaerales bacterium]|nr:permease [Sedimentisphaerales bacterium]
MTGRKKEYLILAAMAAIFLACFFLPMENPRFTGALRESLYLTRWYARQHVLLCLVPAFFIAGAIAAFVRQASVMKYLGARANKVLAYGVASVSGTILAVCSCTVLPLFAGIYRLGAGLGPATAFLYSGPAINVLAIILTARILGLELGVARAAGAIIFSIVIGLSMHLIFRREEQDKIQNQAARPAGPVPLPLGKQVLFFAAMVGILVFANWARSGDVRAIFLCCPGGLATYRVEGQIVEQNAQQVTIRDAAGNVQTIPAEQLQQLEPTEPNRLYEWLYRLRWVLVVLLLALLAVMVFAWFTGPQIGQWVGQTWGFAKLILPLLLAGVLLAGFLLGRPGQEGILPARWVEQAVGGNSLGANLFAAVAGAFMYFATLTEVPILQGLIGAGMGKGPALALLLAGPALSLPNMLVIRGVMGTRKTIVYVSLVIVMATISGLIFGGLFG